MIQRPDSREVVYVLDGMLRCKFLCGEGKAGSCLESVLRTKRYSDLLSLDSGVSDHD